MNTRTRPRIADGPGPGRKDTVMTTTNARSAEPAAPATAGHERLVRGLVAVAMVVGPLAYLVGGVLEPSAHTSGAVTVAANAAANPVVNSTHLAAFVVASFLLPVGVVGLAHLAWRRTPWSATIGGLLGVLGWLPLAALAALDDLAAVMARRPSDGADAALWDQFAYDPLMNSYLIIYIVGHLIAYVLLGLALHRARVIPAWAAFSMIASSPVLILAFALPDRLGPTTLAVAATSVALLIVGSVPAARAIASRDT